MANLSLPEYEWPYTISPNTAESYLDALALTFSRKQFELWAPGGASPPFDMVFSVFCGLEMPQHVKKDLRRRHPDFVPQFLLSADKLQVRLPDGRVLSPDECILRQRRLAMRMQRHALAKLPIETAIKISEGAM